MTKKLIEIPFNHELIVKEGIVVKTRKGEEIELYVSKIKLIKGDDYPMYGVKKNLSEATFTLKGLEFMDNTSHNDLIMYEEVEVKEPRTIYVVESFNGDIISKSDTLEAAQNIINGFDITKKDHYKITEFIEVIKGE